MKNKNEKNTLSSRTGKAVMDKQVEALLGSRRISDGCSWLASTLDLDQDTRSSQTRFVASEVFLQTRLFPLMDSPRQIDETTLVDLLVDFKRSRVDLNAGFEMSQVTANLLNRFQCHLIDDMDIASAALERELELFTLLADLDFQRIDDTVRERLNSG